LFYAICSAAAKVPPPIRVVQSRGGFLANGLNGPAVMRLSVLWLLTVVLFGLSGCALPSAAPLSAANSPASSNAVSADRHGTYKLVYNFPGLRGGAIPEGGLASVGGVMYGTTIYGGNSSCDCGIVFAGAKSIYNFKGGAHKDGARPNGDLLLVGSTLYGTTAAGGDESGVCGDNPDGQGCGTVFAIDKSGNERVIYRFKGGSDGMDPKAGLVSDNGLLYGTTYSGGATYCGSSTTPGCGILFSIDASGKENVVYRFGGAPDAANPEAALLAVNGTLYGTSVFGGKCHFRNGCGTVFEVTPSGVESVLYAFQYGQDGAQPKTPLIDVNGSLYGTTNEGGCGSSCSYETGGGTLFELSTSGVEKVIHRFSGTPDGEYPSGRLTYEKNFLYGTTFGGGSNLAGTIYRSDFNNVQILYSFQNVPDGSIPWGVTAKNSKGVLYGETQAGGSAGSSGGAGTLFRYTP
jgi:uncharacterized repeat protein (TIGR03803 family)